MKVFWGNRNYVIELGDGADLRECMRLANNWFQENDHFFHLDKFPPFRRIIGELEGTTTKVVDYGSYVNFLFFIPENAHGHDWDTVRGFCGG